MKKITKKEFKELCSFHEYGNGYKKRNAIYFGYKTNYGFKYMVKTSVENAKKNELFNILYNWVVNEVSLIGGLNIDMPILMIKDLKYL